MPKTREELLQELQDLEDLEVEESNRVSKELEAKNKKPETVNAVSILAPKKPRSEKQMEVFKRATDVKKANELARKTERDAKELLERKEIEDKLIKKAIALKKKQIKKTQVIDEIESDEEPVLKPKATVAPVAPTGPVRPIIKFV